MFHVIFWSADNLRREKSEGGEGTGERRARGAKEQEREERGWDEGTVKNGSKTHVYTSQDSVFDTSVYIIRTSTTL